MDLTFGTRLRLQREEHHIPLDAIAQQTKIKLSLLEGLERDDVSRWPKGIFRRSYFRAYARAIGLEPDTVLREFQELYPEADLEVTEAIAKARELDAHATKRRPPTRLRFLIDSAVSALPALHLQPGFGHVSEVEHAPEALLPGAPTAIVRPSKIAPVAPELPRVDFSAVAQLCSRLACALDLREVAPVLEDAVGLLNAVGVILWVQDPLGIELMPVLAHGYPDEMVARLPRVSRTSDNAIGLAFMSEDTRVVEGSGLTTGAVVVPLLTSGGCAGALAFELRHGDERRDCVRAAMTILAAQLSTLVGSSELAEALTGEAVSA